MLQNIKAKISFSQSGQKYPSHFTLHYELNIITKFDHYILTANRFPIEVANGQVPTS